MNMKCLKEVASGFPWNKRVLVIDIEGKVYKELFWGWDPENGFHIQLGEK